MLGGSAKAANWRGPVDCKTAKSDLFVTICSHPELLAEDRQVAAEYEKVLHSLATGPGLSGPNSIFITQQMAWNADHVALCKPANANAAYKDGVYGCAKAMMDERLAQFSAMEAHPSVLMSTGAQYNHVEPWYLRIFARQYEGRQIVVEGWPWIAKCRHPGNDMQVGGEAYTIKVEFERIEPRQLSYICRNAPDAEWSGTVKLDAEGKPYLRVNDLSGVPFPWDKGAATKK